MKISREQLLYLFTYDDTEPLALRWKNPPIKTSRVKPGEIAGSWHPTKAGSPIRQRYVDINGERVPVHKTVWLMLKGEMPKGRYLGFADGNTGNCRIGNLIENPKQPSPQQARENRAKYWQTFKTGHTSEEWTAKIRSRNLRLTYGITQEDYDRMHAEQNGCCAICRKPETMIRHGRLETLSVDHCHTSHSVRGLLCTNCNNGLGRFGDDPEVIRSALAYVESWRITEQVDRADALSVAAE